MSNINFANALGSMDSDEKEPKELIQARSIDAEPHEIVLVDNAALPDMSDIERKLAQGEKQLEELIVEGMAQTLKMFKEADQCEPGKQARYLEVAQMMMAQTLSAITHKTKLQLEKKKARMAEASYGEVASQTTNNNVFFGTLEDVFKQEAVIKRINSNK